MTNEHECLLHGAVFQPLYSIICSLLTRSVPLKTTHKITHKEKMPPVRCFMGSASETSVV